MYCPLTRWLSGDYNLGGGVTWAENDDVVEPVNVSGGIPNALLDLLALCDFGQLNSIKNHLNRTLDLFITNLESNRVSLRAVSELLVTLTTQRLKPRSLLRH